MFLIFYSDFLFWISRGQGRVLAGRLGVSFAVGTTGNRGGVRGQGGDGVARGELRLLSRIDTGCCTSTIDYGRFRWVGRR